jgi:hypothetical protein
MNNSLHVRVMRFIATVRGPNTLTTELYTNGQCYQFFLILRTVFPEAEAWYDYHEGHVYSKIGRYWYDIRGVRFKPTVTMESMSSMFRRQDKPHRWPGRDKRCIVEPECVWSPSKYD